jgi:hypothetical protein
VKKDPDLYGISDKGAQKLYAEGKAMLEDREQWNAATVAVLKSAVQWMQEAADIARMIADVVKGGAEEKTPTKLRGLIKNRAMCESEMRKNLDDLLLLPQRPRGRPAKEEDEEETDELDKAWDGFDGDDPIPDDSGGDGP